MVRQAHHARHYILSLSKGQSDDKGVCKFAVTPPQPLPMVGQASSPDIIMTDEDVRPTNEGSLKAAAAG